MECLNNPALRGRGQRAGGSLLLAVALTFGGLIAGSVRAEGGSAFEASENAQDQQNRIGQAATTQGIDQTSVPSRVGFVGPR